MESLNFLKTAISPNSKLYERLKNELQGKNHQTIHPLKHSSGEIKSKFVFDGRCDTSSMFLKRYKPEEWKALSDIRQILSNDGMNPHKSYFPKDFFVREDANEEAKSELIKRFEFLKDDNWPLIQHGERGIGKTLIQNILLHEYNTEFERNKIFWVRCDVHKLYDLWNRTNATRTDIETYLGCQMLYVFCKYYEEIEVFDNGISKRVKSAMFNEIFLKLKDSEFNKNDSRFIRHLIKGQYVYLSLSDTIEIIRKSILIDEGGGKGSYRSYLLDSVLKNHQNNISSKDDSMIRWLEASEQLKEFLKINDYYILHIIDGIDNINFSGNPEFLKNYYAIIKNVSVLLYQKPQTGNIRTYFSMREDTFYDIKSYMGSTVDTNYRFFNDDDFYTVPQNKPERIKDILNERIKICFAQWEKENQNTMTSRILKKFDKIDYKGLFYCYYREMNIRDFLYNQHSMIRLLLLRQIQKGFENDKIDSLYEKYFIKNLFLNGKLYLNSTKAVNISSNEGRYFYNIFYGENNSALISCRILQLLLFKKIKRSFLIKYLNVYFSYEVGSILASVRLLKSFDLIRSDIDLIRYQENLETIEHNSKLKYQYEELINIEITTKGKQILNVIFSDLEILYTLSLDSPLPEFLIPNYIDSFYIEPARRTYYIPHCIKSGLTFLNYLRYLNNTELQVLKRRQANPNLFQLEDSETRNLISNMNRNCDSIFSLESFINVDKMNKQLESLHSRISIDAEKQKLNSFITMLL